MKKIVGMLIVCILLMSTVCPVLAADNVAELSEASIEPRNTNIKYSTISLTFNGNAASCSASVTGYSSNTNYVAIYLYLQKYSGGSWTNVASWSDSASGYTLTLGRTHTITSGRYRLKASYYAGNENIVKYSSEKVY